MVPRQTWSCFRHCDRRVRIRSSLLHSHDEQSHSEVLRDAAIPRKQRRNHHRRRKALRKNWRFPPRGKLQECSPWPCATAFDTRVFFQVVYATSADLAKLPFSDMAEGFYLVGSGNTGVGAGLATMGAIYAATVMSSAMLIRRPQPGYIPAGYTPPATQAGGGMNVDANTVLKTPQFWLLFSTSTLLCTGGMGLMSVAKPMIADVFTTSMPSLVTASFASSYLMVFSNSNVMLVRILFQCTFLS